MSFLASGFLVALLIGPGSAPPQAASANGIAAGTIISGAVRDARGGALLGASGTARVPSGGERQTTSDASGKFSVAPPAGGKVTLIVRSAGFAEWRLALSESTTGSVEVVLTPATLRDRVTVTPTRSEQQLGTIPASVSVISLEDIQRRPATVPDDLLRQLPEFSLFRRSTSLSAHPTSQGVSLRGIGPSGVSRSLVLLDGVPFNDAFGGWVYWTRVPLESVDRIEVIDGSSSSLYGNYGMGGVINIIPARAGRRSVEFKTQYGNHNSPKGDFFASNVWGKFSVAV